MVLLTHKIFKNGYPEDIHLYMSPRGTAYLWLMLVRYFLSFGLLYYTHVAPLELKSRNG